MKLDHRRTILVGLAFLSICAFWQMYDSVIPKILTETFRLNETISGAIMALDNILALFLLPLFGALSDRTSTKIGRRMPFILAGTVGAVVLMVGFLVTELTTVKGNFELYCGRRYSGFQLDNTRTLEFDEGDLVLDAVSVEYYSDGVSPKHCLGFTTETVCKKISLC